MPTASQHVFDYLKQVTLFDDMASADVEQFARASSSRHYKKGYSLHFEDDEADSFYVIRSGWVKLAHTTEEGIEIVLGMQSAGSWIGEQAAFEHSRHASMMQIAEDAELIQLPIALLKKQLSTSIQMAHNIMLSMAQRRRHHELQRIHYMLYSAPQRIGCFLLKLVPANDLEDGMVLTLPYEKAHIASGLGMRSATFSRALKTLRAETGVRIHGSQVKITSLKRLLAYVGNCYSRTHYRNFPTGW